MKRLALLLLLWSPDALGNPLDAFGFGARGIALGGAATSVVNDFSANYYNPAGLAVSDALRLEVGYAFNEPVLTINGGDLDVDPSRGVQGGIVLPGRLFGRRVGVSLGLFLPDGLISRVRSLPQTQPRFVLFDNRPQRLVISTSVAVETIDNLFIGAGLTYISNTEGRLGLYGKVSVSDPAYTKLFSEVDVEFSAVRYPTVGILYQLNDNLSFGVTYRHEFMLRLDLGVDVHGDVTLTEEELVLVENGALLVTSLNSNLFSPRQVVFGASYQDDRWLVSFDLAWLDWSRFPPPVSAIELELDLGDLDFAVPIPDRPLDPGFHDIFVSRIGGELLVYDDDPIGISLRAGYFFEPSPAPEQNGATNYVDGDKHGFALGAGFSINAFSSVLPRPLEIDLAGQLILMDETEAKKTDPADPVGDYRATGHLLGGAITMRFLF